jgi:hypothetical protein
MTAEERYPECDGRLMAGSQAGACGRCLRHPATAAPAARRGHCFAFANDYKCV